jgi:curved DNA-binding protein CbpA
MDFNELEFNLYELLNLPSNCTISDVKKQFRIIVKKFHPDKISKLEEKIYYNITFANHILSKQETKDKYDDWLNHQQKDFNYLKNNFKNSNVEEYIPKNRREANIGFLRDSEILFKRHGNVNEDTRSFDKRIKNLNNNREDLKGPTREHFINTDHFNNDFDSKKENGVYSDKIIKYENDKIIPYEHHKKGLKYVDLRDFDKLYVNDTVQTDSFTSLNRAFGLQPVMKNTKGENISKNISEYKKLSEKLQNLNIDI